MTFLASAAWLLRHLPPETAHNLAIRALGRPLPGMLRPNADVPDMLRTRLGPIELSHPLGLAAGFDKNARAFSGLESLGFSFIETGTVTRHPQPGNPKPRLFQLADDDALINRMGFNNDGLDVYCKNMQELADRQVVLGANIGINRQTETTLEDFALCLGRVRPLADYVTINVSSPNTPGLRDLQEPEALDALLQRLVPGTGDPPLFLKLAPDLSAGQVAGIVDICLQRRLGGLIVSNTTTARPASLHSLHAAETGGLSGRPLTIPSTDILRQVAERVRGRVPIIGVGGIFNGADAYAKMRAGASALQIYTAFVLRGPDVIGRILRELSELLQRDGVRQLDEIIGVDVRASGT